MADNLQIIRDNVQKMVNAGAPPAHINGYLKQRGLTPEQFKAALSGPQAPTPEQQQAAYLRSYGNRPDGSPAFPSDDPANVGREDMLRENPSDPLTKTTGFVGNVVDAMMFGGADEALSGIRSLSPNLTFKGELERLEQARRDYNAGNPVAGKVATGTGIVLNPANVVGGEIISAGVTVPARIGRAALIGGSTGAATGALTTEGDAIDRLTGAGIGAGVGMAAGLAGQPGAELLGFGARKGYEGAAAVVNTLKNQSLARSNPQEQADRLVARAFLQDNIGLGNVPAPLPGQGMVNLGGENVKGLGRLATVAPGQARQTAADFFETQSAGAIDRAADSLQGLSNRGYYGTLEVLDKSREAAAAPLYKAAREKGAAGVWNDHLSEIIKRPSLSKAWARAQIIAADRGEPLPQIFEMDAAGNIVGMRQVPDMKAWDYIKRGLDDVIAGHKNQTTGKIETDAGRGVVALKREMLEELDALIPEYRAAREAYSGPSHSIEMVEKGRDFWKAKGDPADAIREFENLSAADKDYVRIGIVRDALKDIGNTTDTGSAYVRLFSTPNRRALLQKVFPDRESFERFAKQMQAEKEMLAANRMIVGGSPTSRIDAEKADAAMQGASDVLSFADAAKSGSVLRLLGLALDKGQNLQRGITPEVADVLANRLFTTNPEQIQRALQRAGSVQAPAPMTQLQPGVLQFGRRTPLTPLSAILGGHLGSAVATPVPVD
jgi:hypothetical protein